MEGLDPSGSQDSYMENHLLFLDEGQMTLPGIMK